MSVDLGFVTRIAPTLAQGLGTTVALAIPSILLSALWAIPVVVGLMARSRLVARITADYVELVRNTPMLVQMFFIFFGSGVIGFPLSGFVAALLALVLQNGAYVAEIYRGGIQSVAQRQAEAGLALGLTKRKTFAIVVLPQAIRKVVPSLSNQGILIIKDTSLAATVSVAAVSLQTQLLADSTAAVFEIFFTVALFYLALTAIFAGTMRVIERRVRIA